MNEHEYKDWYNVGLDDELDENDLPPIKGVARGRRIANNRKMRMDGKGTKLLQSIVNEKAQKARNSG